QSIIIGVAPAGAEIATRPFQLVTGRVWKGTAFGGARGRTDVPKIVDWYMEGKIEIDPMITHTMPLPDIIKGFELLHESRSIRSVVWYGARKRHRERPLDDAIPDADRCKARRSGPPQAPRPVHGRGQGDTPDRWR